MQVLSDKPVSQWSQHEIKTYNAVIGEVSSNQREVQNSLGTEEYAKYQHYIKAYEDEIHSITNHIRELSPISGIDSWVRSEEDGLRYIVKDGEAKISTPMGTASIMFDLNGNNKADTVEEYIDYQQLFALDENHDGLLNDKDSNFDKLKLVLTDENNSLHVVSLSSVMSFINLENFVDQDKVAGLKKSDEFTTSTYGYEVYGDNYATKYLDPRYTYEKISSDQSEAFFNTYANTSGWVDVTDKGWDFSNGSIPEFAYQKTDASGESYFDRLYNTGGFHARELFEGTANSNYIKLSENNANNAFMTIYNSYYSTLETSQNQSNALKTMMEGNSLGIEAEQIGNFKSVELRELERDFESMTGMKFSVENLEMVKKKIDSGNTLDVFTSFSGGLAAIKQDEDGGFLLKFQSGQILKVDELYMNTGDTLKLDENRRISKMKDTEIQELDKNADRTFDREEIDYEAFGIEHQGKLQTLQEAGVALIKLLEPDDESNFSMEVLFENGKRVRMNDLYSVTDLTKEFKVNSEQEFEKLLGNPYYTSSSNNTSYTTGSLYNNYQ